MDRCRTVGVEISNKEAGRERTVEINNRSSRLFALGSKLALNPTPRSGRPSDSPVIAQGGALPLSNLWIIQ